MVQWSLAHDDDLVHDSAALALVNLLGEEATQEARTRVRRLLTATGTTPLPYGDLATLATKISERRLPGDAAARAQALIARLAVAAPGDAFPLAGDLLAAVFDDRGPRRAADLTAVQRDALSAVARLGDGAWSWLNLLEVLRYWSVPDKKDDLLRYLE